MSRLYTAQEDPAIGTSKDLNVAHTLLGEWVPLFLTQTELLP